MRQALPVTAFDLDTLERYDFPSLAKAASHCMVDKSMLQKYLHNDQMWRGWYWCPTADVDAKMDRVQYLSRRWKSEERPKIKMRKHADHSKLVSLRIDSHTCILVTPDKATEEYAEIYRSKLKKARNDQEIP